MIIALIDDNPQEQIFITSLLAKEFEKAGIPIKKIDLYTSGKQFWEKAEPQHYDLIILDIVMPGLSGIDLARQIRAQNQYVRIVFCSSSNDFASESYDVGASYYIQKPLSSQDVAQMIERLSIEDFELRKFISLPDQQQVLLRNIIFAEYTNHVITIKQKRAPELKTRLALNQFADLIKDFPFLILCNKGTIVNLYEVTKWNGDHFIMSNHQTITISRRKKNEVEKAYRHFLFTSARKDL